jgi:hypothetical protein
LNSISRIILSLSLNNLLTVIIPILVIETLYSFLNLKKVSKFVRYEQCPRCADRGRDRAGDNLAVYDDGSKHCFANCGFHVFPKHYVKPKNEKLRANVKGNLPYDFDRDVPSEAWKWLLQYGLGVRYWIPYTGYSKEDSRLILTVGEPIEFSIGRFIPQGQTSGLLRSSQGYLVSDSSSRRKWHFYGDSHVSAHVVGDPETSKCIVLVEDLISAHKVGQVTACIPLFGTNVFDAVISVLRHYRLPVVMWLDKDQQDHARKRAARLASLTGCEVTYRFTDRDPKELSIEQIKKVLYEDHN